jgi:hypothetical protein
MDHHRRAWLMHDAAGHTEAQQDHLVHEVLDLANTASESSFGGCGLSIEWLALEKMLGPLQHSGWCVLIRFVR